MVDMNSIRRIWMRVIFVSLTLFLGGCFVSQSPLISSENAIYPFQSITLYDILDDDEEAHTLTRRGEVYVDLAEEDKGEYLFAEIDEDLFIVQMSLTDDDGEVTRLYGMIDLKSDQELSVVSPLCEYTPDDLLEMVGIATSDGGSTCMVSSLEQLGVLARLVVDTDIRRTTYRIVELVR